MCYGARMTVAARLTGFSALLAGVFALAALAGARADLGSSPPRMSSMHPGSDSGPHGERTHGARVDEVRGLAVSGRGLTLELARTRVRAGRPVELAFRITDRRGAPSAGFDVEHAKRMHLILARRDLSGFQHLHPRQAPDGSWSVRARLPEGGSYRLFADFGRGGRAQTLGADLAVDRTPRATGPLPAPATVARAGGLTVRQRAPRARAGREAELEYTVTRAGRRVPVQPYLGARGHLVALREGDLAFLHVHPEPGPPALRHPLPLGRPATACSCRSRPPAACARRPSPIRWGDERRAPGAADHRDDLRLLRQPGGEAAEHPRGRDRHRELRHRAGDRGLPPGRRGPVRPDRRRGGGGLRGPVARRRGARDAARTSSPDRPPCCAGWWPARRCRCRCWPSRWCPSLQFDNWQWLALNLATPVVLWGAWPFHRAAWVNLRHGQATMDTLVSVGVLAAWLWSLYALFIGQAGVPGMRMAFDLIPERGEGADHIYLETAAVVTTLILAGRWLEARAKRHAGSGAEGADGAGGQGRRGAGRRRRARRIPIAELAWAHASWSGRARRWPPTAWSSRATRPWTKSLLTGEPVPVEVGPGDEVVGATVNAGGRLVVRATRVGSDTALGQIARLVSDAQAGKAPVQRLADRVSPCSCPWSSCWPPPRWASGWAPARAPRSRSPRRWRC